MLKTIYLLPILLLLSLSSCIEDFVPDVDTRPVLCLNSVITAGEPVDVQVSRTWFYTDTAGARNHTVQDATIRIYANGSEVNPDQWLPSPGDLVRIEAFSPTYGEASAEVRVPLAPVADIGRIDTIVTSSWSIDYGKFEVGRVINFNLKVELFVHDPNPASEYYHVGFSSAATGEILDDNGEHIMSSDLTVGDINYEAEPIFSEHIGELDYISGADPAGFTFFTDRQFTGSSYTLHLDLTRMQYTIQATHYDPEDVEGLFFINLSSVSESYYNYANYLWQTGDGLIGDLSDIGFSAPVWGYSNVSTGAGLVCARTPLKLTVNLRDFILAHIQESE